VLLRVQHSTRKFIDKVGAGHVACVPHARPLPAVHNAAGQESVSQFPHEVAKRNGPLLFRLFQGGAGVFEVDSVHFLTGRALQEV